MKGHIITPEGKEVASTKGAWNAMPSDWKSLAAFFPCEDCPTKEGQNVDHPAGG